MKDHKIEKLEKFALQSSISNTLTSLNEAQRLATKREDMEALIAIAERWVTIAEKMKALDENRKVMLGFTMDEQEIDEQH